MLQSSPKSILWLKTTWGVMQPWIFLYLLYKQTMCNNKKKETYYQAKTIIHKKSIYFLGKQLLKTWQLGSIKPFFFLHLLQFPHNSFLSYFFGLWVWITPKKSQKCGKQGSSNFSQFSTNTFIYQETSKQSFLCVIIHKCGCNKK